MRRVMDTPVVAEKSEGPRGWDVTRVGGGRDEVTRGGCNVSSVGVTRRYICRVATKQRVSASSAKRAWRCRRGRLAC